MLRENKEIREDIKTLTISIGFDSNAAQQRSGAHPIYRRTGRAEDRAKEEVETNIFKLTLFYHLWLLWALHHYAIVRNGLIMCFH